ncbi:MAG: hypothetical protein QW101_00555 [Ignisphaera sp.]|uniref:Uncharacterized protein n=2 Tax=Ignisphaera aggregans TaxID=334771 RepID=A0A7J3MYR3_9CREN
MVNILTERINLAVDIGFNMYVFGGGSPCIVLMSGGTKSDGCGIATLRKLVKELKDLSVQGTIKIIPQVNEYSSVFDINKCLKNRVKISSPLCRLIDRVLEIIANQCMVIEIVCRPGFIPYIVVSPYKPLDDELQRLVKSIPIDIVVKYELKSLGFKLAENNCKAITIVGRGGKTFDLNDVEHLYDVLLNALTNLGFMKRKTRSKSVEQKIFSSYNLIKCTSRGLFIPMVHAGSNIESGSTIGTLDDIEIKAQHDGVALYVSRPKLCDMNETVCVIVSQA